MMIEFTSPDRLVEYRNRKNGKSPAPLDRRSRRARLVRAW